MGITLGLKYTGSLFHNNTSTLVWDNPINLTGVGNACVNTPTYQTNGSGGPCCGRMDLYPSNQAHTFSLAGTAALPMKTSFWETISYGWRHRGDHFLPFTINPTIAQPRISATNLDGDVRPLMVNATLVNRYFDKLDLKAYYRLYDYDNRSKRVSLPDGYIKLDSNPPVVPDLVTFPYAYSRQNMGMDAAYTFAKWLTGKFSYGWERMHRDRREVLTSDEFNVGPTFDIKPSPWALFRASYRHYWRDDPEYDAGRQVVIETAETPEDIREARLEALRKFDEAARHRDKVSLYGQYTVWEQLTLHSGFELTSDRYPNLKSACRTTLIIPLRSGLTIRRSSGSSFSAITTGNGSTGNLMRCSAPPQPRHHNLIHRASGLVGEEIRSIHSPWAVISNL